MVLPTIGREGWDAAARSVLASNYDALELFVVDDGSSPALTLPPDLADDGRTRMLRLPDRSGPGAARNLAHAAARGSLLAYLDDDDAWLPDKLGAQVELLAGQPQEVAAAECGYDMYDDRGEIVLRYRPSADRDLRRSLLRRPCMVPSTVLVRRDVVSGLGGFDADLWYGQDWMLWLRFSRTYRVVVDSRALVRRRLHRRDPCFAVEHYPKIVARIEAQLDDVPRRERRAVLSFHRVVQAAHLAGCHERRTAVHELLIAWLTHPLQWRAPLYLLRAVVGPRRWPSVERRSRRLLAAVRLNPVDRSW